MTTIPSNSAVNSAADTSETVGATAHTDSTVTAAHTDSTAHSATTTATTGADTGTGPTSATPNRAPTHDSTSFEKKKHNILGHLENLVGSVTGNKAKKAQGDQKVAESLEAVRGNK